MDLCDKLSVFNNSFLIILFISYNDSFYNKSF